MSMERFSVVHQSANEPNFAFFRGERDLLGQGRGLEGEGAGVSSGVCLPARFALSFVRGLSHSLYKVSCAATRAHTCWAFAAWRRGRGVSRHASVGGCVVACWRIAVPRSTLIDVRRVLSDI